MKEYLTLKVIPSSHACRLIPEYDIILAQSTLLLAPGGVNPPPDMTAYANGIASLTNRLKTEKGIQLNVTGVANEPDTWTSANIADGISKIRAALNANGNSAMKIIAPESSNCDDHWYDIMVGVKNNYNSAWNTLNGIGSHSYNMCATEKWAQFAFTNNKEYWMTEASANGLDSPTNDVEATSIAARFLNDVNHGVSNWIYFIAYSSDTNDSKTKFIVYDIPTGQIIVFCKYYYMKQLFTTIKKGAIFRHVLANGSGEMDQTYNNKSPYNAAAAKNPDGGWNLSCVNGTGIQGFTAQSYKFTFDVPELASAGNVSFTILRSNVSKKIVNEGMVTMVNGRVSIVVGAKEVVTLTSGTTTTISVTGVTVAPTAASVAAGATTALTATVAPSNATNKNVTWSSSNTAVATVSTTGVVTGVATGSATITVTTTDGNKTASCAVTVTAGNGIYTYEAESGTFGSGAQIQTASNASNGSVIGNLNAPGSYTQVSSVNGGSGGTASLVIRYSNGFSSTSAIGLYVNNTFIQNVSFPVTGGWNTFANATVSIGLSSGTGNTIKLQIGSGNAAADIDKYTVTLSGTVISVTGVTVAPTTASVAAGASATLTATVAPSNATNKSVTWSSSNTAVATVSTTGVVTGLGAGSATITVTTQDGNKTASCAVTVTGGAIGINVPAKIEAENWTAMSGVQSQNTTDTGGGQNVGYIDQNDWLDYAINVPNAGTYTVDFRLASINSGRQLQLKVGATTLVTVNVPQTGGWQTWQTVSASVNLGAGAQTIRTLASNGNGWNINWFEIKGASSVSVTGVTLNPTSANVAAGATTTLTATIAPSNATNKNVTWSSSNTAVATVSSTGVVTGVAAGTATITVTTTDGNKTATCFITITSGGGNATAYEAENGTYGGGGRSQTATNASNGYLIGNLNAAGSFTQVSNVNGGAGGNASLVIRYSNGFSSTSTIGLYVNNTFNQNVSFPVTGGWNTFSNATVSIGLPSGTGNTIKLQIGSGNAAADIDKYTVTPSGTVVSVTGVTVAPTTASVATVNSTVVKQATENGSLRVYPNPITDNELHLNVSEVTGHDDIRVTIFDLTGNAIKSEVFNSDFYGENDITIQLNELNAGVYLLLVQSSNKFFRSKIIKK